MSLWGITTFANPVTNKTMREREFFKKSPLFFSGDKGEVLPGNNVSPVSPFLRQCIRDIEYLPEKNTGTSNFTGMNFRNFFCKKTNKEKIRQLTGNNLTIGAKKSGLVI